MVWLITAGFSTRADGRFLKLLISLSVFSIITGIVGGRFEALAAASSSEPLRSHSAGEMELANARVPAAPASLPRVFSGPPSDQEILVSGFLPQPLAPMDAKLDAGENRALGSALIQYRDSQRAGAPRDAVGPLTAFLDSHPASRWRAALYLNLGIIYRQTGHMSKALQVWQRAWDLSKHATDSNARAIADFTVGELAEFEAYLGRMETLAPLLAEVKGRPMHGTGATNILNARLALAEMRSHPELSFRCGPMAVQRIFLLQGRTGAAVELESRPPSTNRGTSLVQVAEMARKIGLEWQMVHREPGAALMAPAVMHWKVGHFAAITEKSGGYYRVEDPTFGKDISVSGHTIDEEGSGYLVVPAGPLPKGWRTVPLTEGEQVWGRGFTASQDPQGTCPCDQRAFPASAIYGGGTNSYSDAGMTTANVQAMVVGLTMHDTPLAYRTPKGPPVNFGLYYSHLDAGQPMMFTYTNFGPKWTSNWISYFVDNTGYGQGYADLYTPGGGGYSYQLNGTTFARGVEDQAAVSAIVSAGRTVGFTRELPNGSIEIFAQPMSAYSNVFFLSSVRDPQGNKVTLSYDGNNRITAIIDAAGEVTTLTYGLASDMWKVTKITDPFGRSAFFTYNGNGQLASIKDVLGIVSQFTYSSSSDFISALVTPYGTTGFTYADQGDSYTGPWRIITITDPLGQKERVEFREADENFGISVPGINDSDPPNTVPSGMPVSPSNYGLSHRNTFVWDKHQLPLATNRDGSVDYTKSTILHFLIVNANMTSRVLESVKPPLENRVWFEYQGQSASLLQGSSNLPIAVARVLDDGSTQLVKFRRNIFGHVQEYVDPAGRRLTMTYAGNGIDLLSVANTTGGANQLLHSATYNSQHEPLMVTDAAGQVTTHTYNSAGQLLSVTDPLKEATSFTYGPNGLLLSFIEPFKSSTTHFAYDGFNRVASVTDPQGYQLLFSYDAADRLISVQYPDATTVQFAYRLLDLASVTDRLKRTTHYLNDALRRLIEVTDPLARATTVGYCGCGGIARLIDPNKHITQWTYDLEGRPIAKTFADNTRTVLGYEQTTSRLRSVTDALGQLTSYTYNSDGSLKSITYTHAVNPTPSVSFTWDSSLLRLVSMTDGIGTTTYNYNPITSPPAVGAGQLNSVSGPNADAVSYGYDELGRVVKTSVDGALSQSGFDSIDRLISLRDPIDTFNITYLGATGQPASINSAHGLASRYAYFGNIGDERLKSITNNSGSGTLISSFQYTYDAAGEVTSVLQKQFASATTRTMNYDADGELVSRTATGGAGIFQFGYDAASNRSFEKVGSTTTAFTYNNVNELTSPGMATYDKDGEPVTLNGASFQWDAAKRLISVKSSGGITKFVYDGLGRRARIIQLAGTTVVSDKRYFWCGNQVCLETNAANKNAITKRYFPEGVVRNGNPSYYTFDNLGSVREMAGPSGVVQAGYDYDPYGMRTRLAGTQDSDFGFAGLFHESQSGLDLGTYRAYSSQLGRWLSRDSIGEAGGTNLYGYVRNNPISGYDPSGLVDLNLFPSWDIFRYSGAEAYNEPGVYTVAGHGIWFGNWVGSGLPLDPNGYLTPQDLARRILNDPKYIPGMPIKLLACKIANYSFPLELAQLLGTRVIATTGNVSFENSGPIADAPWAGVEVFGPPTPRPIAPAPVTPDWSSYNHGPGGPFYAVGGAP